VFHHSTREGTAFRIASAQFGVACSYIGDIEAEAVCASWMNKAGSIDPGKPI